MLLENDREGAVEPQANLLGTARNVGGALREQAPPVTLQTVDLEAKILERHRPEEGDVELLRPVMVDRGFA